MDYKSLGERIRQQRKLMKMTQEELAAVSDVSTSYIGHIERGIKHCSLDTLICICNALNTQPNELLQDSLNHPVQESDMGLSPKYYAMMNGILQVLREHDQNIEENE